MIDTYTIISSLLKGIFSVPYLMPILVISVILLALKPIIKGKIGEVSVAALLATLPKDDYITLNNIMIESQDSTTQIDHVVVSQYGVFVIETKNYSGWIFGKEADQYWTQTLGKRKSRFYNPKRQNYGHIKALQALLPTLSKEAFVSIITFSNNCELKSKLSGVVYNSNLLREIKQHQVTLIPKYQVESIADSISSANINDQHLRKQHVRSIKERHK